MSTLSGWKASVRSNIVRKVAELKRDGTVGMSEANLWQVVQIPTDVAINRDQARSLFSELVRECGLYNRYSATGQKITPFIIPLSTQAERDELTHQERQANEWAGI